MIKILFFISSIALFALSGCAKPAPEEICSPEWIKPRVDSAFKHLEKNTRKSIRTLSRAGDSVRSGGVIGPLRMLSVLMSLQTTIDQFVDGQTLKDLRTLGETCDDPELVARSFRGFLKDKGVPDVAIEILEDLQEFQKVLKNKPHTGLI